MGTCQIDDKEHKQYIKNIQAINDLLNDEELNTIKQETMTYSDLNYYIILIQKNFRRYLSKKKYKEILMNKLEHKKEILKSFVVFKESWELYFNTGTEFEFSFKGIQSLLNSLIEIYNNYFNPDYGNYNLKKLTIQQIKNFNFSSLMKKEFRICVWIYLKKSFYLGDKLENKIGNINIFVEELEEENVVNPNLNNSFEDSPRNHDKKLKTYNDLLGDGDFIEKKKRKKSDNPGIINLVEIESNTSKSRIDAEEGIFSEKSSKSINFRKAQESDKKLSFIHPIKSENNIKKTVIHKYNKNEFKKLLNKSESTSTLNNTTYTRMHSKKFDNFENNNIEGKIPLFILDSDKYQDVPYFLRYLHEIKIIQEKSCISKSYEERDTNIIFSGSFNAEKNIKEGLGLEYMINKLKGRIYKYCGYYLNGQFHGLGMLAKSGNECYYGEFRKGRKCGYGFFYTDNFTYNGFFKDDLFEGYGEIHFKGKYSYCGIWKNGLRHGIGFYLTSDGATFCGEFNEGHISGNGCFKWPEGQMYYGMWDNDLMDGYGEYHYKNGDKFVGYYKKDLKHGKGKYYFKNGVVLKGKWIKGKKEGEFILTSTASNNKNEIILRYENDVQLKN